MTEVEGPGNDEKAPGAPRAAIDDANTANLSTEADVANSSADSPTVFKITQSMIGLSKSNVDKEDNVAVTDGEEVIPEAPKQHQPAPSVPPHLRPDFQSAAARQSRVQDSKVRLREQFRAPGILRARSTQ